MKQHNTDLNTALTALDDAAVEEIAEQYPVLDEAMKKRIEHLCMEKLSMEQNMITEETCVQSARRPIWRQFGVAAAACLVIAAGVAGLAMLQNDRNSIEPGTETNETTGICQETQREDTLLAEMEPLFAQYLQSGVIHWCDQLAFSGEPLDADRGVYAVDPSPFADYAAYESFIRGTYTTEAAEEILAEDAEHPYQYFASDDGSLCTAIVDWTIEGLPDARSWENFIITIHSYDEASCRFSASPTNYTDEELAEGLTYSISCTAVLEEDGWRITEPYHPDCIETITRQPEDPSDRSEGISDLDYEVSTSMEAEMRHLFSQNLMYIQSLFVGGTPSVVGDPVNGDNLYQVDTSLCNDYISHVDYLKGIYCDAAAEIYLTSSNYGIGIDAPYPDQPLYVEYEGMLCVDMNNRIDGYRQLYPFTWSNFDITIIYKDESTCVFEAMSLDEPIYDGYTKEDSTQTCTALFEDGQWVLQYMYY